MTVRPSSDGVDDREAELALSEVLAVALAVAVLQPHNSLNTSLLT